MNHRVSTVQFEGKDLQVTFVKSQQINEGVACDTYTIDGDSTKDLAVVEIKPGFRSLRQKVLKGTRTIQRFISGAAYLYVDELDGSEHTRYFKSGEAVENTDVQVQIGEIMQWSSLGPDPLMYYEICEPPFEKGRFEDLAD